MRIRGVFCLTLLFVPLVFGQGNTPKEGYVPNSDTAVQIAEAVLIPVYGKKHIESERPFAAKVKDGVWTVSGTLHCSDGTATNCVGGVAVVEISKADARILSMIHYQ
jgi:NTF2 fold immunity protein